MALGALLSYYDTFFSDLVIPEGYEERTTTATTYNESLQDSPGLSSLHYPNGGFDLFEFCVDNMDTDYQAFLLYEYNESLYRVQANYGCGGTMELFNSSFLDSVIGDLPMTFCAMYQPYISTLHLYFQNQTVINQFDSYIKGLIDDGYPVLLHIMIDRGSGSFDYHSVVAYEYDEQGIYANFGWDALSTRVLLTGNDYVTHVGYFALNYSFSHTHSNHYVLNGATYCGCGHHVDHFYPASGVFYSNAYHLCFCECGMSRQRRHVIDQDTISTIGSTTMGYCVCCDAWVEVSGGGGIVGPSFLIGNDGSHFGEDGMVYASHEDSLDSGFLREVMSLLDECPEVSV